MSELHTGQHGSERLMIYNETGQMVAQVRGVEFKDNCALADLFAAAPDLLAVARLALANLDARSQTRQKWTTADQRAYEALNAAIRKAQGWEYDRAALPE